MKTNLILVPFVAVLALLLVMPAVLAEDLVCTTTFNGVELSEGVSMVGMVGETVPVRVTFIAPENMSDVKVKVWMGNEDSVSTDNERLVAGMQYTFDHSDGLILRLPSELKDLGKEYTLHVSVSNEDSDYSKDYTVMMQRGSYDLNVLSVDYTLEVEAGDIFPVVVVLKNTGMEKLSDVYVFVSIPQLDLSSRVYAGDLYSMDKNADNEEDAVQKVIYLKVPENAVGDLYDMDVTVYNGDTSTSVSKLIRVGGTTGSVLTLDGSDADDVKVSTSVVALTVILAIVFLVLLVVLVVLLTRKEKPVEEVETSYY